MLTWHPATARAKRHIFGRSQQTSWESQQNSMNMRLALSQILSLFKIPTRASWVHRSILNFFLLNIIHHLRFKSQ